jgi:hypothetical protein
VQGGWLESGRPPAKRFQVREVFFFMTGIERRAMEALESIRYAPYLWHEARAFALVRLWKSDHLWHLSQHEQNDLWFLIWHYRRQVFDAEVISCANEYINGALPLRW